MSVLHVVIIVIVIGVLLWAVNKYIPMQEGIKRIVNILVILVVIIWLLKVFGVLKWLFEI